MDTTLDLREAPDTRITQAAYYALRDLPRGDTIRLYTRVDPRMNLDAVNLQLRNGIRWTLEQTAADAWVATVHRSDDVAAEDLFDALKRDHKKLDQLFGMAIHRVDAGALSEARGLVSEFLARLKRHLTFEDDVLTPALKGPSAPPTVEAMVADHRDILAQAEMIDACFGELEPEAALIGPLMAILAGMLSKHELREESQVFPYWHGAFGRLDANERAAWLDRVNQALGAGTAPLTGA